MKQAITQFISKTFDSITGFEEKQGGLANIFQNDDFMNDLLIIGFIVAYGLALQIAISGVFPPETPESPSKTVGVVNLIEANGSGTTGLLLLVQSSDSSQVSIRGRISQLSAGSHGFHVHETGATGNECVAAGGHFNPTNMDHGMPTSTTRHVGDLGNIVSTTSTGVTTIALTDSVISLQTGNIANILNRAIVIHALPDDFTQPTGAAGARHSCGIIEVCDTTCQQTFDI